MKLNIRNSFTVLLTVLALMLFNQIQVVHAGTTITVNTFDDELNTDGDCSLREAIQSANSDTGGDACPAGNGTDTINVPSGTFTLSIAGYYENANVTGDLDVTTDLNILGESADSTIINGNGIDRVLHVMSGTSVVVSNLTLTGGNAPSGTPGGGGGIFNQGTLLILNSQIKNNQSGLGGGISNFGHLTVENSTIIGNSAGDGGGISNFYDNDFFPSVLTVINSTISGNFATDSGGVLNVGTASLTNVTVSENKGDDAGGITNPDGSTTLKNTIVANNTEADGTTPSDCQNAVTSAGHNLDSDGSCVLNGTGDISSTDPLLGPLQNNGGPTETYALLPGSPAIDAGGSDCPATDQRGITRPQGSACDIGAFELVIDSDGDGIIDSEDSCPFENATGFDADQNGCLDNIQGLSQVIDTLPDDALSEEIKNSLASKVSAALNSIDKEKDQAAINQLQAFINEIYAQKGKKISEEAAELLISYANNIILRIQAG